MLSHAIASIHQEDNCWLMVKLNSSLRWGLLLLQLFVFNAVNTLAAEQGPGTDSSDTIYLLRTGDTVNITVFDEPDLSVSQKLDLNGVVIIPLLGRTDLSGLSLRDAETKIEELFISEEYLIRPQVSVTIVNYAEQVFYVFGEVNRPGSKSFPEGRQSLDILEAITLAGDLSQYAKRSEIVIRRPIKGENREEKIIVDLDEMIRGSKRGREELILVYPEDRIFVPERIF